MKEVYWLLTKRIKISLAKNLLLNVVALFAQLACTN